MNLTFDFWQVALLPNPNFDYLNISFDVFVVCAKKIFDISFGLFTDHKHRRHISNLQSRTQFNRL